MFSHHENSSVLHPLDILRIAAYIKFYRRNRSILPIKTRHCSCVAPYTDIGVHVLCNNSFILIQSGYTNRWQHGSEESCAGIPVNILFKEALCPKETQEWFAPTGQRENCMENRTSPGRKYATTSASAFQHWWNCGKTACLLIKSAVKRDSGFQM